MKKVLLGFLVLILLPMGGFAQTAQDDYHPTRGKSVDKLKAKKFSPIEMRFGGTDKKPTQDFYYEGSKLESTQQLKAVIDPLNDFEASNLLNAAERKKSLGTVFMIAGAVFVVGGGIYAITATGAPTTFYGFFGDPHITYSQPDLTLSWVLGGAGVLAGIIGVALEGDGGQCRQDAVQRYNHLIEPDQNLSMMLLPQTNSPGLQWIQRF